MPRYASFKGSFVYHVSGSATESEYIGAKMLFAQAAAPTGWTKVTTYNDAAIRITNTTVTPGGTGAFSTQFASKSVPFSGTMTITGASTNISGPTLPAHTHSPGWYSNPNILLRPAWQLDPAAGSPARSLVGMPAALAPTHLQVQPITSDNPHTHPTSAPFSGSTTINAAVQYVDVIIATKN